MLQNKFINKKNQGFTLTELIIAIMVLAAMATAVLVFINPAKKIAQAQDFQRQNDITKIAVEIRNYMYENNGEMVDCEEGVDLANDNTWYCIGIGTCMDPVEYTENCSLSNLVPDYLAELPQDPTNNNTNDTGYAIKRNGSIIYIKAPYVSDYYEEEEMMVNTLDLK